MILILEGDACYWVPYYDLDSYREHLLVVSPIMISIPLGDIC